MGYGEKEFSLDWKRVLPMPLLVGRGAGGDGGGSEGPICCWESINFSGLYSLSWAMYPFLSITRSASTEQRPVSPDSGPSDRADPSL